MRRFYHILFFAAILLLAGVTDVCGRCRCHLHRSCCCCCCDSCKWCRSADSVLVILPELDTTLRDSVITFPRRKERKKGYLFAIRTNLLFDLATALNVELEVPIGKRFSIAGEWIFPDWVDRTTNEYCLQANIKSLEFRTWLGNRFTRRKLTGHYLGVYGQMGNFDFQPFTEQGIRCYDFWAAGLSYGFAHTLGRSKTLSMEYGIGVGFVSANYCRYERSEDGSKLITHDGWQGSGWFILPTKLKVSLVWLIPYSVKVKNRSGK